MNHFTPNNRKLITVEVPLDSCNLKITGNNLMKILWWHTATLYYDSLERAISLGDGDYDIIGTLHAENNQLVWGFDPALIVEKYEKKLTDDINVGIISIAGKRNIRYRDYMEPNKVLYPYKEAYNSAISLLTSQGIHLLNEYGAQPHYPHYVDHWRSGGRTDGELEYEYAMSKWREAEDRRVKGEIVLIEQL